MIKSATLIFLSLFSLNTLAEDVIITTDAEGQAIPSNGPVVNMRSQPKNTFFSFGSNNNAPANNNSNNVASSFAAGSSSNLFSYEAVISSPDSANNNDGNNNDENNISLIINAGVETVMPTGFSLNGGFSFIVQDSFETAFHAGGRFYSGMPILNTGAPAYSYIGVGMLFVNGSTFYPEIGIRLAPSNGIRMDFFFKTYTSSDEEYDRRAMLGIGLSF